MYTYEYIYRLVVCGEMPGQCVRDGGIVKVHTHKHTGDGHYVFKYNSRGRYNSALAAKGQSESLIFGGTHTIHRTRYTYRQVWNRFKVQQTVLSVVGGKIRRC